MSEKVLQHRDEVAKMEKHPKGLQSIMPKTELEQAKFSRTRYTPSRPDMREETDESKERRREIKRAEAEKRAAEKPVPKPRVPKISLLSLPVGSKDGNQELVEKKSNGIIQLWKNHKGNFGVVRIVNNQYVVLVSCRAAEDYARDVYQKEE